MFNLGNLNISRVEELVSPVPVVTLGDCADLVRQQGSALSPNLLSADGGNFWLVFQTWILRRDGLTIVVDPCNGNGRDRPVFPRFHQLDTPFLESFEATGVRPEDVDVVFCTHLHCDHCGWNTRLKAGRWVPTFPRARYMFVRREVDRWGPNRGEHKVIDYNVGVFEDSVAPIIDAGLAELVDDQHAVSPGVSILPAHGHTMGHSILRVETGESPLYFTGDAFHHPFQVSDPRLNLGGCDDLDMAIATRERLRSTLADEEAVMLPAHFPAPHAGRVIREQGGFRFAPISW